MAAALTCYGAVGPATPSPILFAPGTGSDGSQVFLLGGGAFEALGRPLCVVSFPRRTTADLQISVQYLVDATRHLWRQTRRRIALAGVSQGGLLIRMALTYWPSLRAKVRDVVTAAATHHGSPGDAATATRCLTEGCPPALWQQRPGSALLRALNDGRDETPGETAYTTVRSATDETVRPQTGPAPTSALRGAANILIQDVCPERRTSHLGTAVDSVTFAALADAVNHRGPARVSRLPADVCDHAYGTGLDEARTSQFLALAPLLFSQGGDDLPVVRREPKVRGWVKRGGTPAPEAAQANGEADCFLTSAGLICPGDPACVLTSAGVSCASNCTVSAAGLSCPRGEVLPNPRVRRHACAGYQRWRCWAAACNRATRPGAHGRRHAARRRSGGGGPRCRW